MFSAEEIKQLRAETTGTQHVIHFNNAGAALMPDIVRDAQLEYIRQEAITGGYETAAAYHHQLEHTYDAVAELINAQREEIALVENATAAWHLAFQCIDFKRGDIILTSMSEYASNYISFLHLQQLKGIKIKPIPCDDHGQVSMKKLKKMVTKKVKLIAITHIPTNNGLVNPAEAIGKIAHEKEVLYLLDACQSVGQVEVDVKAIGCDFLSATGRKYLRGPRGTGFLFVKKSLLENGVAPPILDLHSAAWTGEDTYEMRTDARRFENWESNKAAIYGLGIAVEYALSLGMDRIEHRVAYLAEQLRTKLSTIDGVQVHDIGEQKGGIVSVEVEGWQRDALLQALGAKGINASPIFYNGTLLDMNRRGLGDNLIRASLHYYNTEDEIDTFCEALKELIE